MEYFTDFQDSPLDILPSRPYHCPMSNRVSHRRSAEHNRIVLERRRSNAAQPHKNKAKYSRKPKHRNRFVTE